MPVSLSKSASPPRATPPSRYLLSSSENLKGGPLPPVPHPRMSSERSKLLQDKDYSYVKFPSRRMEPPHEYSYPKLIDAYKTESVTPPLVKPGPPSTEKVGGALPPGHGGNSSSSSSTSSKKSRRSLPSLVLPCVAGTHVEEEPSSTPPPMGLGRALSPASNHGLLDLETSTMTLTCAHCQKPFSQASNRRGACQHAPQDWARSTVETVTCLSCAKCLLYHCMSDSEGDYGAGHPCDCSSGSGGGGAGTWGRRWLGLTLLSILVPCLCCYFPLMACYKGGAACSLCGGRHQAASPSPK